ncbi:MAG: phosphate transporter, phosphate-binding protein [Actinomycetia bacterium]|jgi:phosphate transport system substrate-binding protein|nr:phosphate transporter, phosphate-binding protein [Actinomycetes bacterium]
MQLRGSKQAAVAGGAAIAALALAACSSSSSSSSSSTPASSAASSPAGSSSSAAAVSGTINASGSTFQTNFQQAAISAFKSVQSGITVNYGGGGSGAGRTALYSGTVLFAGSDSPIPASEKSKVPAGKTVLYFPVQIGPIAIAYNLGGVTGLKLDATVLAGIFQGTITTWNDPAIKALNPGVSLPSTTITPTVRSDSSGTTQNFSEYLVKAAGSAWKLGSASTVSFPKTAHAASGGSGLASAVKATSGAIGYVDASTATASGLSMATIKNSSGDYVAPTPAAATAAATHVTPAANLTFLTVDEPGATSYPITYQSWDLVYATQANANDAALLKAYIGYLLGPGQQVLTTIGLAPLPSAIDSAAVAQLSKITS